MTCDESIAQCFSGTIGQPKWAKGANAPKRTSEKSGVFSIAKKEVLLLAVHCSEDSPCAAMQLLTQTTVFQGERIDKMEKLIESMRNRLPLWATLAFTASGATIGILAGHIK